MSLSFFYALMVTFNIVEHMWDKFQLSGAFPFSVWEAH